MSDKLTITIQDSPRGFYVTVETPRPSMGYVQRTPYGPLVGAEVLQLVADLPVRFVVSHEQRSMF